MGPRRPGVRRGSRARAMVSRSDRIGLSDVSVAIDGPTTSTQASGRDPYTSKCYVKLERSVVEGRHVLSRNASAGG